MAGETVRMTDALLQYLLFRTVPPREGFGKPREWQLYLHGGYGVLAWTVTPETAELFEKYCPGESFTGKQYVVCGPERHENEVAYLVCFSSAKDCTEQTLRRIAEDVLLPLPEQVSSRMAAGVGGPAPIHEVLPFCMREAHFSAVLVSACAPVRKLAAYLKANVLNPELTVEDAADAAYLSYPYACSLFAKEMGVTMGQYLRMLRLQHSLTELLNGSVQAGAWASGFRDEKYFMRVFKKEFGFTPGYYIGRTAGANRKRWG